MVHLPVETDPLYSARASAFSASERAVPSDFCMVAYVLSQPSLLYEVPLELPSYPQTSNI